jgi:hypothetical protein
MAAEILRTTQRWTSASAAVLTGNYLMNFKSCASQPISQTAHVQLDFATIMDAFVRINPLAQIAINVRSPSLFVKEANSVRTVLTSWLLQSLLNVSHYRLAHWRAHGTAMNVSTSTE